MTRDINILSVTGTLPAPLLAELAATSLPGVRVVCTAPPGEVGVCRSYRLQGEDLWAEVAFKTWFGGLSPGMHAEGLVAIPRGGGAPFLAAVMLTTLPRGMLAAAALGKPFTEAVADATRESLRRQMDPRGKR